MKRYQSQNWVPNRDRHSERPAQRTVGQAQRIEDRHNVFRTGTAYRAQVKRIEDKHRVLRTGTAY